MQSNNNIRLVEFAYKQGYFRALRFQLSSIYKKHLEQGASERY